MKDYWKEAHVKKPNKKKTIFISMVVAIILFIIVIFLIYINNSNFRTWLDKNILRKEITNQNLPIIELEEGEDYKAYAYSKYIVLLKDNNLKIYGSSGKEESKLNVEITNPIFNSNGRYLAIGEEKGQNLYIMEDKDIIWDTKIEGNISKISINKNGYVAVTIVDTLYKTVIAMYDNKGNELFHQFLSSTRVTDVAISDDNKYLALAEIDTSGTMIKSSIKVISIEKGKTDSLNAIEKVYDSKDNDLIINIRYADKNKLLCMYTDRIDVIRSDGSIETLTDNNKKKMSFQTINLQNYAITIEEKSSGLFTADSVINLINSESRNISTYKTDSVTKEIYTSEDVLALNLGTEIEFINKNGWLIKKYLAQQEVTKVIVSNSIAGIIYRDRIEIINL